MAEYYKSQYSGKEIETALNNAMKALRIDGKTVLTTEQISQLLAQLYAVSYSAQSLTATQKTQARKNIDAPSVAEAQGYASGLKAVSYSAQGLSEAQKAQARRNIGAGEGTGGVIAAATQPTDPAVQVWINTSGSTPVLYVRNTAGTWYAVPGLVGPAGPALGVNPNLLDNWFFANPVNQRGQSSYAVAYAASYTIDRWQSNYAAGTVALETDGIRITDNGTNQLYFRQRLEFPVNGLCTASLLVEEVTGDVYLQMHHTDDTWSNSGGVLKEGLNIRQSTAGKAVDQFFIQVNSGASIKLKAAKLELGEAQTLASQDSSGSWVVNEMPNYGEQLERCQRFCFVHEVTSSYLLPFASGIIGSAGGLRINLFTPVAMRAVPVITNADGIEYLVMYGNKSVSLGTTGLSVFNVKQNNLNLLINLTEYTAFANATLVLRGEASTTKRLIFSADL